MSITIGNNRNALSGLNPTSKNYLSTVFSNEINRYLSFGFNYIDYYGKSQKNCSFGNYKVISQNPFRIKFTVKKNKTWSDGTPINATDLLLNHLISSSAYSRMAGLGDPQNNTNIFRSTQYGSSYDDNVVGNPIITDNGMSLILTFTKEIPDWELFFIPGPFPVHALVLMAEGKTTIQPVCDNIKAKNKFYNYFMSKNTEKLRSLAPIFNNSYNNISEINDNTNQLILVSNGGYIIKKLERTTYGDNIELVKNPYYNCGPVLKNIVKIIYQATNDLLSEINNENLDVAISSDYINNFDLNNNYKSEYLTQSLYEHLDIRVNKSQFSNTAYTGIFKYSDEQKSKDLRTAFLLAFPREKIVNQIYDGNNTVLNSLLRFEEDSGYDIIVNNSGILKYTQGTQEQRTAQALALVQKYYPDASPTNPIPSVNINFGLISDTRRLITANLAKEELTKAGFNVTAIPRNDWTRNLNNSIFDAQFFAWQRTAVTQNNGKDIYLSYGEINFNGYNNQNVDSIYNILKNKSITDSELINYQAQIEKELINNDAVFVPLYRLISTLLIKRNIQNFTPSAYSNNWNYWEWSN